MFHKNSLIFICILFHKHTFFYLDDHILLQNQNQLKHQINRIINSNFHIQNRIFLFLIRLLLLHLLFFIILFYLLFLIIIFSILFLFIGFWPYQLFFIILIKMLNQNRLISLILQLHF